MKFGFDWPKGFRGVKSKHRVFQKRVSSNFIKCGRKHSVSTHFYQNITDLLLPKLFTFVGFSVFFLPTSSIGCVLQAVNVTRRHQAHYDVTYLLFIYTLVPYGRPARYAN